MKTKHLKKLVIVALCMVTIICMSVPAFAAENITNGQLESSAADVQIKKTLTVTNPDLASVDGPGISYSYTIAPVEPSASNGGTTVTDAQNHTGVVKAGVAGGVTLTTASVTFPIGTAVDASASGAPNVKYIVAHTDITKFTKPGIYRYELTETQNLGTTGTTDGTDPKRYLDVYIVNGADGLEIAGYTLADKDKDKTDAFDGTSPEPGDPYTNPARFETVNLTLTKDVQGNMGDKNNQFPFTGTVTDSGRYFYAAKGTAPTAVAANQIAGAAAGSAISTTLADSEVYYISGLSHEAAVTYTETNNTDDTYVTAITGGTASAGTPVAPNGTKAMTSSDSDDSLDVTFVNTLDSVSPTGVVLRFGAPLLLVAAGLALVLLNRKAKKASKM